MDITPGNLIDQLSIVNIKIYMLEDAKRDKSASDTEIAEATRKTNSLNSQRNALIEAIDEAFNAAACGKKVKSTGQNTKQYGKGQ